MIDITLIREKPDLIRGMLKKRNYDLTLLDKIIRLDNSWKKLKKESDELRKERNKKSKAINIAKKSGKDIDKAVKEMKDFVALFNKHEEKLHKYQNKLTDVLYELPNLIDDSLPVGDESKNRIEKTYGKKPNFKFTPKSHHELLSLNDFADIERAGKVAGSRFYYLKNDLVKLELALMQYGIDFAETRGMTLISPPYFLNQKAYRGCVDFKDLKDVIYKVDGEDLYLIGTAEHPLVSMYMEEILDQDQLPIKLTGWSPSFRKEAGTHGKDEKGIFRVHRFNKVEQVVFSKPENSWKLHQEILQNTIEFFKSLNLHFNVVTLSTQDVGFVSAKTYDLEVWLPGQNKYRELASISNCLSFQSRRLNIKYRTKEGNQFIHTLNGTLCPLARMLVAILENNQTKDGKITVPKVLEKYIGKKILG